MTDYNLHPYQRAAAAHVNGALDRHTAALHIQQVGRALRHPPPRIVCARRARKLRRRGEHIGYTGRTSTGKALYVWLPKRKRVQIIDHDPMAMLRRNIAENMRAALDAHDQRMHEMIMAPPPTHYQGIAPRPTDHEPAPRGYRWNPRTLDWDDVPPTTNQGQK